MIWFAAALLLLAIAWLFQLSLLSYAMYAVVAVMFVSRFLAKSWAESLSANRECNRVEATVGESVAVNVQVANDGKLPVAWILLEDLLPTDALIFVPPKLSLSGERIKLVMLWPGNKRMLNYSMRCNRRGYYQIGPLVIETGDLFGLHRRFRVVADPHFVMVLPKVIPLLGYELASRRPIGEVRMSHRLYEDPTRIAGVRQYQDGDALNRIHWKATARTGVLHSKVYEPSTIAGATILLDFHIDAHDRNHEPFRSEIAITAAASIANAVCVMGQQIGLVTNGRDAAERIRVEGWKKDYRTRASAQSAAAVMDRSDRLRPIVVATRRGVEQFRDIQICLARLELTDGLHLPQLISETQSRLPRDATVVVITPRPTPEGVIALGMLRRSGYAVTAILNVYDDQEYADAAGPLLSEGIETRHLRDEDAISRICQRMTLR
jgi:uncharacterized protein (DUF58 family)